MNIDDKIKKGLNAEQQQLDTILTHEAGIFKRLGDIYQGRMKVWVIISTLMAFLASLVFIYCGYRFTVAPEVEQQVFWGVWFIAGLLVQVTIKLWLFMEMNRVALLKELKRTELNLLNAQKKN